MTMQFWVELVYLKPNFQLLVESTENFFLPCLKIVEDVQEWAGCNVNYMPESYVILGNEGWNITVTMLLRNWIYCVVRSIIEEKCNIQTKVYPHDYWKQMEQLFFIPNLLRIPSLSFPNQSLFELDSWFSWNITNIVQIKEANMKALGEKLWRVGFKLRFIRKRSGANPKTVDKSTS